MPWCFSSLREAGSRKTPKTPSGIETVDLSFFECVVVGRKTPKTLSGIETSDEWRWLHKFCEAGKHLKPYQGLKPASRLGKPPAVAAGKHLKPYQGLKRDQSAALRLKSLQPENT